MRPIFAVLSLGLLAAARAAAQPGVFEQEMLRQQQEAARRDAINLHNDLSTLDARVRTEQALSDLRQQRQGVPVPELRDEPAARTGSSAAAVAAAKYPSVPDAILEDSNRKVREASKPRR